MLRHDKSAPIWLFSFVDLAFLLLIAFTQIGLEKAPAPIDLAELEIPRINGRGTPLVADPAGPVWQLRIHPPTTATGPANPFELIEPATDSTGAQTTRAIDAGELAAHLRVLHDRATAKPVLAPHRDSRSEDLLIAVSLLEDVWQSTRTVAVRPGPAVASGSDLDVR